jgi:hypothetical protein
MLAGADERAQIISRAAAGLMDLPPDLARRGIPLNDTRPHKS